MRRRSRTSTTTARRPCSAPAPTARSAAVALASGSACGRSASPARNPHRRPPRWSRLHGLRQPRACPCRLEHWAAVPTRPWSSRRCPRAAGDAGRRLPAETRQPVAARPCSTSSTRTGRRRWRARRAAGGHDVGQRARHARPPGRRAVPPVHRASSRPGRTAMFAAGRAGAAAGDRPRRRLRRSPSGCSSPLGAGGARPSVARHRSGARGRRLPHRVRRGRARCPGAGGGRAGARSAPVGGRGLAHRRPRRLGRAAGIPALRLADRRPGLDRRRRAPAARRAGAARLPGPAGALVVVATVGLGDWRALAGPGRASPAMYAVYFVMAIGVAELARASAT